MKINQDQFRLSKFRKFVFDMKRGSGHMAEYLANRFRWHYYPRFQYVSRFPDHVDVEISSACNMKCPMCYTLTDEFKSKVKRQFMEMDLFKKIVDECARFGTYSIRISLRGEPFIHKDAVAMIRYAKDRGIKEVSSLTNNLALTPELFKASMDAGLDWLTISFDGLGQTYESIRKPAKFEESFRKIQAYSQIKKAARSLKPVIKIQTVWPAIKENAREFFDVIGPYCDDIAINPLVDYLHKDKQEDITYIDNFNCPVLYQRLVVGSDGIIPLCSNDEFNSFPLGDANKECLVDIWRGAILSKVRKLHMTCSGVKELEPCRKCFLPRKTVCVQEKFGGKFVKIDKYLNREDEVGK